MNLTRSFHDALREVEAGRSFVPFVQGEAARLERCAIAAKRVFELPDGAAVDPTSVARSLDVPVIGNREQFDVLPEDLRKEMLGSRQWSAGTIAGPQARSSSSTHVMPAPGSR